MYNGIKLNHQNLLKSIKKIDDNWHYLKNFNNLNKNQIKIK